MTVLTDWRQEELSELAGNARKYARAARGEEDAGRLAFFLDELAREAARLEARITHRHKMAGGYAGSGDVRLHVEAEVSADGEDSAFYAINGRGQEVDITEILWQCAPGEAEGLVDAILEDASFQRGRYGSVWFEIPSEEEAR